VPVAWTCPNPKDHASELKVRWDAGDRAGNEHLIALTGPLLSVNPVPSCAKFWVRQDQTTAGNPVTSTFARSEGFEPPTF
jgi:hypothetical protein